MIKNGPSRRWGWKGGNGLHAAVFRVTEMGKGW